MQHAGLSMIGLGGGVNDVVAGGIASADTLGEAKATACGFEDCSAWDGLADSWVIWLWVGSWLLEAVFVVVFKSFAILARPTSAVPSSFFFFLFFFLASSIFFFFASSLFFLFNMSPLEIFRCVVYFESNIRDRREGSHETSRGQRDVDNGG